MMKEIKQSIKKKMVTISQNDCGSVGRNAYCSIPKQLQLQSTGIDCFEEEYELEAKNG